MKLIHEADNFVLNSKRENEKTGVIVIDKRYKNWVDCKKIEKSTSNVQSSGGEYCGIVQISCQKFQLTEHNNEISAEVEPVTFNKYVKPPSDAIWDTYMCRRVHGLHCEHEKIRDADDIATVWNQSPTFSFTHTVKFDISRSLTFTLFITNSFVL